MADRYELFLEHIELNTSLLKACSHGHLSDVKLNLQSGADLETRDDTGNTPLLICSKHAFTDIADFLLEMGADVNALNASEETPLIVSVSLSGSLDLTKLLLKQKNIDVNRKDKAGYTALMVAIEKKDLHAVQILFQAKAKLGSAAKKLAEKQGIDKLFRHLKPSKNKRRTPLHRAVLESDIHSMKLLLSGHLSCPADPKSRDYKIVTQYLDSKIRDGCEVRDHEIAVVKTLLEYGASVVECDVKADHFKPLHKAVKLGSGKLVKTICAYGIHQGVDQDFTRAVAIAKENHRYDLAGLMTRYVQRDKKIIRKVRSDYRHAITAALERGHVECARNLLKQSARKPIPSLVLCAVRHQNLGSLKILVELESEQVKQCVLGTNLLDLARKLGNREIVNLIIDLRAEVGFWPFFMCNII